MKAAGMPHLLIYDSSGTLPESGVYVQGLVKLDSHLPKLQSALAYRSDEEELQTYIVREN